MLILAGTVPYYGRRHAPLVVLVVTASAISMLMLLDYEPGMLPWVLLVGGYTVAALRPARAVWVAAAVLGAWLVALYATDTPTFGAAELVASGAAFGAAMLLGRAMQSRGRHIEALQRSQVESALRAAADERLRIAQELQDIVAHSLGLIAVQAGVGMHVVDSDPSEARRALENISHASRSSLAEIRRLLGVMPSAEGTPTYTPAPGLRDLARLTREVSDAGLTVVARVDDDLGGVPPGVSLAAYRIAQEALTNALRHAGARHAQVRVEKTSGMLLIEVTDDGHGSNDTGAPGHGLVGMRERVAGHRATSSTVTVRGARIHGDRRPEPVRS